MNDRLSVLLCSAVALLSPHVLIGKSALSCTGFVFVYGAMQSHFENDVERTGQAKFHNTGHIYTLQPNANFFDQSPIKVQHLTLVGATDKQCLFGFGIVVSENAAS